MHGQVSLVTCDASVLLLGFSFSELKSVEKSLEMNSPGTNIYFLSSRCYALFAVTPIPQSPCEPSPCGFNAICKQQHGVGSCSCLPDYIGNPYEGCRPECVIDTDCVSILACVQSKCKDPCPGVCGQFAECQVIDHRPTCTCMPGYSGNPFQYCAVIRDIGTQFTASYSSKVFASSILSIYFCLFFFFFFIA